MERFTVNMKRANHISNVHCETCKKFIYRHPFQLKMNKHNYCSNECNAIGKRIPKNPNTVCENCDKPLFRFECHMERSPIHFCNSKCKGEWMSKNITGDKAYNWKDGSWNNRVQVLAHTSYRTWRARLLENATCILCDSKDKLELHHIESRSKNGGRIKDESNVCPICSKCHDIFHSNSSKGGELRGRLTAILAYDNPQPSQSNIVDLVDWKVQRLTGEDTITNKPDTSAAHESEEIVRAYSERIRSNA